MTLMKSPSRRRAPLAACALAGAAICGLILGDAVVAVPAATAAQSPAAKIIHALKSGKRKYNITIAGYPAAYNFTERDLDKPKGLLAKLKNMVTGTPPITTDAGNVLIVNDIASVTKKQAKNKTVAVSAVGQLALNSGVMLGAPVFVAQADGSVAEMTANMTTAASSSVLGLAFDAADHGAVVNAQQRRKMITGQIDGRALTIEIKQNDRQQLEEIMIIGAAPAGKYAHLRNVTTHNLGKPGEQDARTVRALPIDRRNLPEGHAFGGKQPRAADWDYWYEPKGGGANDLRDAWVYESDGKRWYKQGYSHRFWTGSKADLNAISDSMLSGDTASSSLQRPYRLVTKLQAGRMWSAVLKRDDRTGKERVVWLGPTGTHNPFLIGGV